MRLVDRIHASIRSVISDLLELGDIAHEMKEKGFSDDYIAGLKRGYRTAIHIIDLYFFEDPSFEEIPTKQEE
jgi:hypothetical protein